MLTLLLAFINAKYKHDYVWLFFFTVILDVELFNLLAALVETLT